MSAAAGYQLGVDLGTTYTAAAVARDGQVRMVGLGNRSSAIPSVVHLAVDGSVVAGEAADRRGPSEPDRVAREFKRRVGDPTPLLLGGAPYSAEALLGTLLDAVIARVCELEGGPPTHLAVTHPANWGPYKRELFDQCVRHAGVDATSTLTEPEAAAVAYAANERVEPGSLVGVYDLGGGTFDVAILRKTADGFAILGSPEGIERLGGIDFDEAVVGYVRTALGGALERVDPADPANLRALTRFRRECIEAKEALSTDSETVIPVLLPGVQTEVRLTRAEFERMIRPALETTLDAMRRALVTAAVEPEQISTVLLVGGSSRMPLVAELVSNAFGRPIAVDAHPKHAIAQGAVRAASLVTVDGGHTAHDAMVLQFSTAASGAPGDDVRRDARVHDTVDLHAAVGADAGPATPASAHRQPRRWDRRPYDDEPTEIPSWLLEARDDRRPPRPRRRWWTGVIAFLVVSLLTAGAGAFMTSEPRAEAVGDTWMGRGTPATEGPIGVTVDDDASSSDARRRPAAGPAHRGDDAAPASSDEPTGDAAAVAGAAAPADGGDPATADGGDPATADGGAGTATAGNGDRPATEQTQPMGTTDHEAGDPPADTDGSEPPADAPSEPAGGGDPDAPVEEGADVVQQPHGPGEDPVVRPAAR